MSWKMRGVRCSPPNPPCMKLPRFVSCCPSHTAKRLAMLRAKTGQGLSQVQFTAAPYFLQREHSFVAESNHRIEFRSMPGWEIACQRRRGHQNQRHDAQ